MSETNDATAHWPDIVYEQQAFVGSVVHRLAGPRLDVDDLVQEVFLVVHRKLPTLRDPTRLRPWLYGICRRVVAYQRRKEALRTRLRELWGPPAPSEPESPEEQTHSRELERRLYAALDGLTAKRREVLVLFALAEMSGREIAELLDIPEATVWTRLHAARKQLVAQFERQGDPASPIKERLRWSN